MTICYDDLNEAVLAQSVTAEQAAGLFYLLSIALETEDSGIEPLAVGYESTREVAALLHHMREQVKAAAKGLDEIHTAESRRRKMQEQGPAQ